MPLVKGNRVDREARAMVRLWFMAKDSGQWCSTIWQSCCMKTSVNIGYHNNLIRTYIIS